MGARTRSLRSPCWIALGALVVAAAAPCGAQPGEAIAVINQQHAHSGVVQPPHWRLLLEFSEPVLLRSAAKAITLLQDGAPAPLVYLPALDSATPYDLERDGATAAASLALAPAAPRDARVANRVMVQAGLEDAAGRPRPTRLHVHEFISNATFTITRIEAGDEPAERFLKITFSDPVPIEALRDSLRIEPPVTLHWWSSQYEGNTLRLRGDFEFRRHYRVVLPTGMLSQSGLVYEPGLRTFAFADLAPRLWFTDGRSIIERDSRQLFFAKAINQPRVHLQCLRVPPLLVPEALELAARHAGNTDPRLDLVKPLQEQLNQLRARVGDAASFRPFLGELESRGHLFPVDGKDNEEQTLSLPLSFRPQAERGAIELVRLSDGDKQTAVPPRLVRVTDLALTYKRAGGQLLVWATSLRAGLPLPGVEVLGFDHEKNAWLLGVTGADGLLTTAPGMEYPRLTANGVGSATLDAGALVVLAARTADDETYLHLDGRNHVAFADAPAASDEDLLRSPHRAVVFTERGVYRPGETVRLKAVLRDYDHGAVRKPFASTCRVRIIDPRGDTALEQTLPLSDFGGAHAELATQSFSPLGTYRVEVFGQSRDEALAETTFQVQEIRPPRHAVAVLTQRVRKPEPGFVNRQVEREALVARIQSTYFAGGPVKFGRVRWKVTATPTSFAVDGFGDFTFGYEGEPALDFIETGETVLDASGETVVELPLGANVLSGQYGLKLTATVLDFDGRAATGDAVFQQPPPVLIGISRHPRQVPSHSERTLRLTALDAERRPLREGTIAVDVYRKEHYQVGRRNEQGNAYWSWSDSWRRQYTAEAVLRDGFALVNIGFDWGGEYLVRCEHRGPDGTLSIAATRFDVEWDGWYDDQPKGRSFEQTQLVPNRETYAPGDTARLYVRAREEPTAWLLAVERERVLQYRLVTPQDGAIELPISEAFGPNVYISLLGVLPRGAFPSYVGEYDDQAPRYVTARAQIKVGQKTQALSVAIAEHQQGLRALPGERITLPLRVSDEDGAGVQAELTVAVVDEQVLSMTRYQTPRLDALGRSLLPHEVATGDARNELQPQTPFLRVRYDPLTGGGGYEGGGEPLDGKLRENFDPVAYYNPALLTDEAGNAAIDFTLPDSMTTYRIMVIGCDRDARFASADAPLLVVKSFYLEPGLPSFLHYGDQAQFFVSAFNKTDLAGTIDFGLHVEGAATPLSQPTEIAVNAMDRALIPIEARADAVGPTEWVFSGGIGNERDSVKAVLPVKSGLLIDHDRTIGVLSGARDIVYQAPAAARDIPWERVNPEEVACTLTLSGSPLYRLRDGLRYYLRYPYGCVEQTGSGLLALAALRGVVVQNLLPGITVEETDAYIRAGVERLFGMQTEDGGFGYWPGHRQSDEWGSLYALRALTEAGAAGFPLPPEPMNRALDYLSKRVTGPERDRGGWHDAGYRGMAAYILARGGKLTAEQLDAVEQAGPTLGREGRLLTLLAAQLSGLRPANVLTPRAAAELDAPRGDGARVSYRAEYRERAVALMVACALAPDSPHVDNLAGELLRSMRADGRWSSTADGAWALIGLRDYFQGRTYADTPVAVRVSHPAFGAQSAVVSATVPAVLSLDARAFLDAPSLKVELDGQGSLHYELALAYPRVDYAQHGYQNGFAISKTIANTSGGDEILLGDVVKVTIFLETGDGHEYTHLALDDPLPAGLVAINSALASEEPLPASARDEDTAWRYWRDGYYDLTPNHVELRSDRVLVFRDWLWPGKYQFAYYARAVCAGAFRMPSTKVELMYQPEVCAYTPEASLTVAAR